MVSGSLVQQLDAYMRALGGFVTEFSALEAILQTALWQFARLSTPTAQALLPGIRVAAAMETINRIADAQKWPAKHKSELADVFSHLGPLNKLRNDILHYGSEMTAADTWMISNRFFAHVPERIREVRISPSVLDAAAADLTRIQAHLIMMAYRADLSSEARQDFEELVKSPWRYKPPQPNRQGNRSQKTPRRPQRPPPASRESR